MTEAEWLACEAPETMVRHLGSTASERKMRLFVVACCRRIWHSLSATEDRRAVDLAERFADGEEKTSAIENFRKGIDWTRPGVAKYAVYPSASGVAEYVLFKVESSLVEEGTSAAVKRALREEGETAEEARQAGLRAYTEAERSMHSRLLRDIFGNPFRRTAEAHGLFLVRVLEPVNRLTPHFQGEDLNRLREGPCPPVSWPWPGQTGDEVLRLLWERLAPSRHLAEQSVASGR